MTNPVMMVGHEVDADEKQVCLGCWVWCPACDSAHRLRVALEDGTPAPGPVWEWDGNVESPTFSPSYLATWDQAGEPKRCHSFIQDGKWNFCADSTHYMAGLSVPMVPLPDWLIRE